MEDARPDFAAAMRPGDFIVGGRNFGLGSSREHAPRIIKLAGVSAVLANLRAHLLPQRHQRRSARAAVRHRSASSERRPAGGRPGRRRGPQPHHGRVIHLRAAAAGHGQHPRTTAAWSRTSRSTAASRLVPAGSRSMSLPRDPHPRRRHRPRAGQAALATVIDATGVPFDWEVHDAGVDVMEKYGTPLPDARARIDPPHQGGAQGPDHHAGRHGLPQRQRGAAQGARPLRLPAAVQDACRACAAAYDDVDLVIVRENTEDLYAGIEHMVDATTPPRASRSSRARAPSASCASPSSTRASTAGARSPPCTRPTS